jgi:DNA-binding HxlR family transcriptional regulator
MSCLENEIIRHIQVKRIFKILDILKCMRFGLTSYELHRELLDWHYRTVMRDLEVLVEVGRVTKKGHKYHAT